MRAARITDRQALVELSRRVHTSADSYRRSLGVPARPPRCRASAWRPSSPPGCRCDRRPCTWWPRPMGSWSARAGPSRSRAGRTGRSSSLTRPRGRWPPRSVTRCSRRWSRRPPGATWRASTPPARTCRRTWSCSGSWASWPTPRRRSTTARRRRNVRPLLAARCVRAERQRPPGWGGAAPGPAVCRRARRLAPLRPVVACHPAGHRSHRGLPGTDWESVGHEGVVPRSSLNPLLHFSGVSAWFLPWEQRAGGFSQHGSCREGPHYLRFLIREGTDGTFLRSVLEAWAARHWQRASCRRCEHMSRPGCAPRRPPASSRWAASPCWCATCERRSGSRPWCRPSEATQRRRRRQSDPRDPPGDHRRPRRAAAGTPGRDRASACVPSRIGPTCSRS